MSSNKVWLITGCSSGLGRAIAKEALVSGAKVVVTARNSSDIQDFQKDFPDNALILSLDVTNQEQIKSTVEEAKKKFGRIDVLVNNAGCAIFGAVEEIPDKEVRKVFETNFFGLLELTRTVLPIMRAQKSGHIINISAVGGMVSTQCLGIFNATKYAIEGLTEALSHEVSGLGIKVSLIEPGPTRTNFLTRMQRFNSITDYEESRTFISQIMDQYSGKQPGDPQKIAKTIVQTVENPVPPLHLPLGKFSNERIREKMSELAESMARWEKDSFNTDFDN